MILCAAHYASTAKIFLNAMSQNFNLLIPETRIQRPMQIIMPSTACENGKMSHLYQLIRDRFPDIELMTVPRKYFNEAKGMYACMNMYVRVYISICIYVYVATCFRQHAVFLL